ncbi:hypothetical protein VII00023_22809 [Vibrio ichthyoenteri ATCC 700023]|uniref:Uncharacterized protein n=2 Tax=Vibrio ichthyoenteri TaxID=142461 RepID=F9S7G7_9VIBR|nr:hypothetical protein VII00023_22809 [Vibrio ichthyoenteri ATCC 700023]
MAALGLILDLAKCATPLFIIYLWVQHLRVAAIFGFVLSFILSFVSFSASVAALEAGVIANVQSSNRYQTIETQISEYQLQIKQLRVLAEKQQSAKLITRSQQTLEKIPELLKRINTLSEQQGLFTGNETVLDRFGMVIAYITAAILELLSWLFVCVSFALHRAEHTQTQLRSLKHSQLNLSVFPLEHVNSAQERQTQPHTVVTHLNAVNEPEFNASRAVFNDDSDCRVDRIRSDSQLYSDIRDAILAKSVKPSFRGVALQFKGVSRALISQVLNDLHETGFLKTYRKGFAYV